MCAWVVGLLDVLAHKATKNLPNRLPLPHAYILYHQLPLQGFLQMGPSAMHDKYLESFDFDSKAWWLPAVVHNQQKTPK